MNTNDAVIEKIRKCLVLAARGGTQGEAEAAMAKAQEIALRHSIDIGSVDINMEDKSRTLDVTRDDSLRIRSKYRQPYHRYVFGILEKCFGVKIIQTVRSEYGGVHISKIHIIGEVTDVLIAKEVFPWLEGIFPRILSKAVKEGRLTYAASHMNGCYRGLYDGIVETNRREKAKLTQTEAGQLAVVVRRKEDAINDLLNQLFPKVKDDKNRSRKFNAYAYAHGIEQGRNLNLKQMGATASSRPALA